MLLDLKVLLVSLILRGQEQNLPRYLVKVSYVPSIG